MKARLLVGAAVLAGAFLAPGQAQAADNCNHLRNEARKSVDLDALHDLRLRATVCDPTVIQDIEARIQTVSIGAPPPPPPPVSSTGPAQHPAAVGRPRSLTIGQTATGALAPSSPVDAASQAPYDSWSFRGEAGQRLEVSMGETANSGLDTYLSLGRVSGGEFQELAHNDDRGDGTLNSALRFTPTESGDYVLRARSYGAGGYGAYQVLVRPITEHTPTLRPVSINQPVSGSLTDESATGDDGIAYDLWSLRAQGGQRLRISLRAAQGSDLDTYLVIGRMADGQFQELASNDDGGDGTFNSMLRFVAPDSGDYLIRARSFAAGAYGNYELNVEATPFVVASLVGIDPHTNAWVREGVLSGPSADHVDFEFHPVRGKHYSVRAFSDDFTPVVDVALLGADGHVTEVNFFNFSGDTGGDHTAAADARPSQLAEFRADGQGRYILRVSAATMASGHFSVVVSELP